VKSAYITCILGEICYWLNEESEDMQQSPQYHGTSRLENSGNDRGRAHPDSAAIPTTPTPTPA